MVLEDTLLLWFKPSWHRSTTELLAHSPTNGTGERIRRVKGKKLVGWDKDSLAGKAKFMHASKAKQEIHSPFPMAGRYSAVSRKAGLHHVWQWIEKTNAITVNVPSFLLPQALYAEHDAVKFADPFGQMQLHVPAVSPPTTPGWDIREGEKALTLCKHCSAVKKNPCVIHTVSSTKPKYSSY